MTLDQVIDRYTNNAEYERIHGSLQGCLEFRQLAEWLKDYKRLLEQQPCEDAVSRKDAEQMFRNIRSHLKPQDYKSAEEFNTRDLMLLNAEQMIHALPSVTQKSGKWIPFSERLPKPFEHCLITTIDGEVIYHYDDGQYSKYKAWMPLPKPYEPQESEKALDTEGVLDKIEVEIESNMESIIGKYDSSIPKSNMPSYKIERNKVRKECISIIDKYR